MRIFPQGVTVVTWTEPDGARGMTVSAFTSLSLNPPLVLISISKDSSNHDAIVKSEQFAVNFLASDQGSISDRFAGRLKMKERFEGVSFAKGSTGSPVIAGARAVIECLVWRSYDGGDHTILLGEVVRAGKLNGKAPLVYYGQGYTTTGEREQSGPPFDAPW